MAYVKRPATYSFVQFTGSVAALAAALNAASGQSAWSGLELPGSGGSPTILFSVPSMADVYYRLRSGAWYAPITADYPEYQRVGPLLAADDDGGTPAGFDPA